MHHQSSSVAGSLGCGLSGCFGGLILGLIGGSLLLIFIAFINAIIAPAPVVNPISPDASSLRVSVAENFLNRFIEQPTEGAVKADILPNNQAEVVVLLDMTEFGLVQPVEIAGLFQLRIVGERLEVAVIDIEAVGVDLPLDLTDLFSDDIITINQDLERALDELSSALGVPIVLTRLQTDDSQIYIELREIQ